MQEELETMRPLLEEAAKNTEVTMETIKVRKSRGRNKLYKSLIIDLSSVHLSVDCISLLFHTNK